MQRGHLSYDDGGYLDCVKRLGGLEDLEDAITSWMQAMTLTPDGHPDKAACLSNLGNGYINHFLRLGTLEGLDESH